MIKFLSTISLALFMSPMAHKSYVQVGDVTLFFDHIDGMYSYCMNAANEVVHIAAFTEVVPLKRKDV